MGYQLWTSPQTGYRRRGTRLGEIRRLFEHAITVTAILEPLKSCRLNASAEEMEEALSSRDFDVAGVQEEEDSPPIGYVERATLGDGIVDIKSFESEDLVSETTDIGDIISILAHRGFVFAVIGPDVRGIVTRADLNKPPVRIFLFGLVSLLEMHLTYWISEKIPNNGWTDLLNKSRLQKARQLQKFRKKRNQEIDLLWCLQLCDKRDLLLKHEEPIEIFEGTSSKEVTTTLKDAEDLRNSLAHSNEDISTGLGWSRLAELVGEIERILTISDEIVEAKARASATDFEGLLLSAGRRS